jgi:hypothetical protein
MYLKNCASSWSLAKIMSVTALTMLADRISSPECQTQKKRQQFESQVLRNATS